MKRIAISLLCVLLCFLTAMPCFAAASADGVLPDPAELLGAGELLAEDYEYDGYFTGDLYAYDLVDDDFADVYLAIAEDRGFDLYQQDDYSAFLLQYDGRSAILFMNDGGYTKLLVENGMAFAGAMVNGPWLPDPCTALNVDGEYFTTNTENNGVTYDSYIYEFTADYEFVSHFIVTYTEALKNIGYSSKKLTQTNNSVWYQQYTHDDYDDLPGAELAVFVSGDAKTIAEGGESGWVVGLAVPRGYSFVLGNGAPGVVGGNTVCIGCGGTGNCAGCGGTGRANYGDGYETCVICDGNGVCNICDGEGSY